jgi:hypothetical protein
MSKLLLDLLWRTALLACLVSAVALTAGVAHAGDGEDEAPSALHETGAKLIKNFVCDGSQRCLKKRGQELTEAAYTVIDACLREEGVPKYICLGMVANISNEGGGLEHPTCGGLDQSCVSECDTIWNTGARRDCFLQCAIDQGIQRSNRKNSKWRRIKKCNDGGSSRGPFQMKMGRVKRCRKMFGKDFDPFDLGQAAQCTVRIVKRTARAKRWPCGRDGNRWLVAMKRVGAGVIRTVSKAKPGRWVPDTRGGRKWIEPQPKITEQICEESGYGNRGLRYYRSCGAPCRSETIQARSPMGTTPTGEGTLARTP